MAVLQKVDSGIFTKTAWFMKAHITASSRTENINVFQNMVLGYGAGLRFMINEKKRVNIGLDYGFGAHGAQGLFVNLNEYF
jgi:hypothetical protein